MNPIEEIPLLRILLRLFYSLRQYGFSLGLPDYMLALEALQGGFGIGNRASLERLCCTLWTKSKEEARQLHRLLDQIITNESLSTKLPQPIQDISPPLSTGTSAKESDKTIQSSSSPPIVKTSEQLKGQTSLKGSEKPISEPTPTADIPIERDEPEQVIQAIRYHRPNSLDMIYYGQDSAAQYLPVTPRQIKQSWRFFRRPVRQGTLQKLNVEATVAKISQQGILIEPVLMPRYVNRVKLVLLVDQGGSMVPFHHLSRQLIDKALRGGNLIQTNVYYFYNYPEKYFYTDQTRIKAQLTTDVLKSVDERAGVLIVSDAGAARGNYNPERVEYTQKFIEQLQQSVRYYAWLNPMPNDSWQYTTAGEIARFVPMFEMSRQGLNAAINTLRGRYVYWERPYQWML
ncbi:hypothetical protein [Planktothrix paucivesiculata]|uniref:VWA containing CoxE family protein n=1 Tax=Planktothrix paucivesiculata PCC 9631 TaxID=671071 RepID=A0A7Z9BSP3_9CYAN|nr:hypothetical protein [Planktothrix paucivesiculata]VXD16693.1 conserved hypothetical protein [Planktothrix paucivesiculata PCC 9631]